MKWIIDLLKIKLDYAQTEKWCVIELDMKADLDEINKKESELTSAIFILETSELKNKNRIDMKKIDVRKMVGMANNNADNYLQHKESEWKKLRRSYVNGFKDAYKILNVDTEKREEKLICPLCSSEETEVNHAIRECDCDSCGYAWTC